MSKESTDVQTGTTRLVVSALIGVKVNMAAGVIVAEESSAGVDDVHELSVGGVQASRCRG